MNRKNNKTVKLAMMAVLTALIFALQFITVPLGAITVSLSMVPVAIAAITMGPVYGLLTGAIWGLASIMKAMIGSSGLTSTLFALQPFFAVILCFIPRQSNPLAAYRQIIIILIVFRGTIIVIEN